MPPADAVGLRAYYLARARTETPPIGIRNVHQVEDPDTYGTMMNRLMRTEARVGGVLTETTAYQYNAEGNVGRAACGGPRDSRVKRISARGQR